MKCINKTIKTARFIVALFFIVLYNTVSINAQSTILKLPTAANTSNFSINDNNSKNLFKLYADGSLISNGSWLSQGTFEAGTTVPSWGAGTRFWWYPKIAAFRAGYANGTQWDGVNVGAYSFASGASTTASGQNSTAMGNNSTASGSNSTAMGQSTIASGDRSTALGYFSTAIGINSTAMGDHTTANGSGSIATGKGTTASGQYSTAMGFSTTASGNYSTAMGSSTTASGANSTAMGNNVSTNSHTGSFIIGDNSFTTTSSNADNQMKMRFSGGYKLFTDASTSLGARLMANANSWSSISDSTKKYAFLPVSGESVLNKISKFNLRSWSYKGQDSTMFRHYGPMAQEFFAAFGHDKYGVAGNDTTISQADFEGINLTAIHALIKRTDELKNKTEKIVLLQKKIDNQQIQIVAQQKQNAMMQNQIKELNKMKTEFAAFRQAVNKLLINKNVDSKIKLTMNK